MNVDPDLVISKLTWESESIKGILHPTSSFTHPQVFANLYEKDILKNDCNFGTIDFHSIFSTMEVNGAKQLFGSNL